MQRNQFARGNEVSPSAVGGPARSHEWSAVIYNTFSCKPGRLRQIRHELRYNRFVGLQGTNRRGSRTDPAVTQSTIMCGAPFGAFPAKHWDPNAPVREQPSWEAFSHWIRRVSQQKCGASICFRAGTYVRHITVWGSKKDRAPTRNFYRRLQQVLMQIRMSDSALALWRTSMGFKNRQRQPENGMRCFASG